MQVLIRKVWLASKECVDESCFSSFEVRLRLVLANIPSYKLQEILLHTTASTRS